MNFTKSPNQSVEANLIRFLCKKWKSDDFRSRLEGCKMYLRYDEICFMLSEKSVDIAENLNSNHEKTGSCLFLHAEMLHRQRKPLSLCVRIPMFYFLGVANAGVINIPL